MKNKHIFLAMIATVVLSACQVPQWLQWVARVQTVR